MHIDKPCSNCGEYEVYVKTDTILTSNPPQYATRCKACSHFGYVFVHDTRPMVKEPSLSEKLVDDIVSNPKLLNKLRGSDPDEAAELLRGALDIVNSVTWHERKQDAVNAWAARAREYLKGK